MIKILYEDKSILVAVKPAGMESQQTRRFEPDMVSEIRNHLRLSTKLSTGSSTGGTEPYVGVIHRLDKPVSGIMVYGKTKKAAAALSQQVQDGRMEKTYWAVVCGKPVDIVGKYVDYLLKDGKQNCSAVVDKTVPGSKRAELTYRVLAQKEEDAAGTRGTEPDDARPNGIGADKTAPHAGQTISLVEIRLLTGRHHQIRAQFAAHGTPLWGDGKYNPGFAGGAGFSGRAGLALCAVRLAFRHPDTGKRMEFTKKPEGGAFQQFEGYEFEGYEKD